jgi:probable F420-dependent oxidoreductase
MELGVFLPVSGRAAVPEVLAEAAQQAENLGYESVWAAERVVQTWEMNTAYPYKEDQKWQGFVAPDVPFLEPLTCLSFLSGITKKVRLGISVTVLPYRHPLITARVATSIDTLSNGRLILGVGVGWMFEEFQALGVAPFEKRGAMANEQLEILNRLWTTDRPTFQGKYYNFPAVSVSPRPVQKPRFPIWTGGESEAAVKRAAKYADAWFSYHVKITAEEMAAKYANVKKIAAEIGRPQPPDLCCCRPIDLTNEPVAQNAEDLKGTPEQLIAALKRFKDIGVKHMALQFIVGRWPERKEKIDRFGKEVMPALR